MTTEGPSSSRGFRWTKESVFASAKGHCSISSWKLADPYAYHLARKWRCLDFATEHMLRKSRRWNDDEILSEALKYSSATMWARSSSSSYQIALRRGIYEKATAHMKPLKKRNGHHTANAVIAAARSYRTRKEWFTSDPKTYQAAGRLNTRAEACRHMERLGNKCARYLYAFEFGDKSVYVGLTGDYSARFRSHFKNSTKLLEKMKVASFQIVRFNELWPAQVAAEKERELIHEYLAKGWVSIGDPSRAGYLGGPGQNWSRQDIEVAARSSKCRRDFIVGCPSAYNAAVRLGIYQEIAALIPRKRAENGHWTSARVRALVRHAASWKEFRTRHAAAYQAAQAMGLLNSLRRSTKAHGRDYLKRPPGFWANERAREREIQRVKRAAKNQPITMRYFAAFSPGLYAYHLRTGALDDLRSRFPLRYPSRRKPQNPKTNLA